MATNPGAGKRGFESDSFRSLDKNSALEGRTEYDTGFDNELPILPTTCRNSEPRDPPQCDDALSSLPPKGTAWPASPDPGLSDSPPALPPQTKAAPTPYAYATPHNTPTCKERCGPGHDPPYGARSDPGSPQYC